MRPMNQARLLIAVAVMAVASHASSAGTAKDIVNQVSASLGAQAKQPKEEYGPDGKLTLTAATALMQGRSPYDMKVYVYLIADRANEIVWDGQTMDLVTKQRQQCRSLRQRAAFGVDQLAAQERELSGDYWVTADRRAQLIDMERQLKSQASYACRGVDDPRLDAAQDARTPQPVNPLKD